MQILKLISSFILLIILQVSTVEAQNSTIQIGVPYNTYLYEEIGNNHDKTLQLNLEKLVTRDKTYAKLVAQKRMAVGLVDLRQPDNIRYAAINPNHMMYAASLPKIAVLLAAMEAIKDGCLNYDKKLKKDLRLMIAKSNNAATTRVIERLGFDAIASVLRDEKYNLYDIRKGGGLWVGKKYAKAGRKNPDPLKGLSHAATVYQVCRYYTMLAYGKLVDEYYNSEMMYYLKDPKINHKFVKTLKKIAPDSDIYRKSGSWRNYHSDSALVYGDEGRRYILVALVESPKGSRICSRLVKDVEKVLGLDKNINPEHIDLTSTGTEVSPKE